MKETSLADSFRDLRPALDLAPLAEIPAALAELESLRAAAWLRIRLPEPATGDRLLTAQEAAERLGMPVKAMYRRRWSFRKDPSKGRARFSEQGLERYIANLGKAVARGPSLR